MKLWLLSTNPRKYLQSVLRSPRKRQGVDAGGQSTGVYYAMSFSFMLLKMSPHA